MRSMASQEDSREDISHVPSCSQCPPMLCAFVSPLWPPVINRWCLKLILWEVASNCHDSLSVVHTHQFWLTRSWGTTPSYSDSPLPGHPLPTRLSGRSRSAVICTIIDDFNVLLTLIYRRSLPWNLPLHNHPLSISISTLYRQPLHALWLAPLWQASSRCCSLCICRKPLPNCDSTLNPYCPFLCTVQWHHKSGVHGCNLVTIDLFQVVWSGWVPPSMYLPFRV